MLMGDFEHNRVCRLLRSVERDRTAEGHWQTRISELFIAWPVAPVAMDLGRTLRALDKLAEQEQ